MNKTKLTLAILLAAAVGCSKTYVVPAPEPDPNGKEPNAAVMSFGGQTRLSGTKSTFDPTVDGQLLWSSTDQLAVYSFKSGESSPSAKDLCDIDLNGVGSTDADFTPQNVTTPAGWVGGAASSTVYNFYSFYPCTSSVPTPSGTGVKVNVSGSQGGTPESIVGNYQVCWGKTQKTAAQVISTALVDFAFTPVTTLLYVKFVLVDAIQVEEETIPCASTATIKSIDITSSDLAITGDMTLDLETGAVTLSPATDDTRHVRVTLSSPVAVDNSGVDTFWIPVVLAPSTSGTGTLSFSVVTGQGDTYACSAKSFPADGFKAGTRYYISRKFGIPLDNSADAFYTDAGNAWYIDTVVDDGAYTDAGNAW